LLGLAVALVLAQNISSRLRAVAQAAHGLAEGDLEQQIPTQAHDEIGDVATAMRATIAYQQEMAAVASAIAAGDLTHDVRPQSERDVLGNAFERMLVNLRDLVGQVQVSANALAGTSDQLGQAAGQTNGAVQQVTAAVQQVAAGAQEQSSGAQSSNRAVEQLLRAIDQVAKGAEEQARSVAVASQTA